MASDKVQHILMKTESGFIPGFFLGFTKLKYNENTRKVDPVLAPCAG